MQIPSFLQKFGRDIVYLCVIGGLMGWIWVDGKREVVCSKMFFDSMQSLDFFASQQNLMFRNEIDKAIFDYPYELDNNLKNQLESADRIILSFKKNLRQLLGESNTETQSKPTLDWDKLNSSAQKLCDSLMLHIGNDQYIGAKIKGLLAQDSSNAFWGIARKSPPYQFPMLVKLLEIKSQAAYFEVLNYLARKVQHTDDYFDRFYPVAISDKPAVLKCEAYKAFVFLVLTPRLPN